MADDERTHAEMTAAFEEKAAALEERTATIRRELFRRDLEHEHALEPGRLPDLEDEDELRHEAERIAANDQLRVRVRPRRQFPFERPRLTPGASVTYANDGTADMNALLRAARHRLP